MHRAPEGQRRGGDRERSASPAHVRDGAAQGDHACGERQRAVRGHAVEYERGPWPRLLAQFAGAGYGRVGTRFQRQAPGTFPDIQGHDAGVAEGAQELDGHVAEAADPDDHGRCPWPQHGQPALDRVIGGERGIGERSGGHGIEIRDRHQVPGRRHHHVLGQAAVAANPAAVAAKVARRGLAEVLHPLQAGPAGAAAPARVDEDPVALGRPACARADCGDRAGGLVSQREGQRVGHRSRGPVHQVQVAVA